MEATWICGGVVIIVSICWGFVFTRISTSRRASTNWTDVVLDISCTTNSYIIVSTSRSRAVVVIVLFIFGNIEVSFVLVTFYMVGVFITHRTLNP